MGHNLLACLCGCDNAPMHRPIAVFLLTIPALLFVAAATACGVGDRTDQPLSLSSGELDPATATLDQILQRSRAAMSEVTSYKTRGETVTDPSPVNILGAARYFTEWQSPDRARNRVEVSEKESQESWFTEIVSVGGQIFTRSLDSTRHEQPPLELIRSEWPYSPPVIYLDAPDIELVSANATTDEGVKVFRPEFSEAPRHADIDGEKPILYGARRPEAHHTLLVSQETYRFVSVTVETRMPYGDAAEADGEAVPLSSINKNHFYDYNVPNVIEIPGEYVLWSETWSAESRSSPPATPTAIPEHDCSEPAGTWPGCGIHTAADVEAMLAVFPEDTKIIVDDDIVIHVSV